MKESDFQSQTSADLPPFFLDWAARRFNPRRYQPGGVGNWSGHLPFAFDLIASLKPETVVELGTQFGESYFGFCQAVQENGLSTRCYAVDTWLSDAQTGEYSKTVYEEVDAYNRLNYGAFSSILRMTFDEAASQFSEASIDLLHIDGAHTYEAVAHDFHTWLPKLKPGAIVLLHDTMVNTQDFGVWRFWEELAQRFPTFGFHHSWGLGVLRIPGSPNADDPLLNWLFGSDTTAQQRLRSHYLLLAESVEYRCGTRASVSVKEWICLKIYTFGDGGYTEKQSQSALLPPKEWKHISFELPQGQGNGPIRIDPSDVPAIIEVAEIQIRAAEDGRLLWHGQKEAGLSAVEVNRELQVLPGGDHFRCASYGFDPQILLPEFGEATPEQPLYVDIWIRVDPELALTLPEQLHTHETRLRELTTERDNLQGNLMDLQQRQEKQAQQLDTVESQLEGLTAQRDRFEAILIELQQRQEKQTQQLLASESQLQELSAERDWIRRTLVDLQQHQQEEAELRGSHRQSREFAEQLREAEDEIRKQRDVQKGMALFLEALSNRLGSAEFVQSRVESEIARQKDEIKSVQFRVEEILRSRIWHTVTRLGEFFLRRDRKFSPSVSTPLARLEISPTEIPPTNPSFPEVSAPPILQASASRHAKGTMRVKDWRDLITSIAASRPKSKFKTPRISIITPVWNTAVDWFAEAAISVLEQSSPDWEWCIVDDGSTKTEFHALFPALEQTGQVRIQKLDSNRGISYATNEALHRSSGEYVCFLDHDDLLVPTALSECLEMLEDKELDAVYTDSDKVDQAGIRYEPFHKPDWSPEYFRGVMYVGHLLCVRRELALKIGAFDSYYDGVQDFEFMLRYSEQTQRIGHISSILYHWRAVPGSVAAASDAKGDVGRLQKEAVQAHINRLQLPAVAESGSSPHRVRIMPLPPIDHPKVSIVIPTKDAPDLLERCLSSIVDRTTYPNFEIICVDNETTDSRALSLMRTFPVNRILLPGKFNYSRANNIGVQHARGEFLVFMNNDIEVITDAWVEEMLYYARQKDVGAVGALLLYPDNTVQHAGVVLGCRGTADHVLRHAPSDSDGYAGSLSTAHEVSAVTAACMMVNRLRFEQAGGFNEHYFTSYQDVDFCLQLRALNLRNIFAPGARFFHLESVSRGRYYDFVDRNLLLDQWGETIESSDPYYNRNFDVETCVYALKAG